MLILVDPVIDLDADMVDKFVTMSTTCNYLEEFAGLSLTCYASKPVEVLPELRVNWLLNDNEVTGEVQSVADDTVATTVTLDSAEFMDANYTCSAELNIPNSPKINSSSVYEVVFKGKCREISRFYCITEHLDSNPVRAACCINWTSVMQQCNNPHMYTVHKCNHEQGRRQHFWFGTDNWIASFHITLFKPCNYGNYVRAFHILLKLI